MGLPSVTKDQIEEAIKKFDLDSTYSLNLGNWLENKSFKYALKHGGKRYPLKTIISIATGMDVGQFTSGAPALAFLQHLGFDVEALRLPTESETMAALYDLLLARFPGSVETGRCCNLTSGNLSEICAVRPGWGVPGQGYPSLVFHGVATHLWRSKNGQAARYGARRSDGTAD